MHKSHNICTLGMTTCFSTNFGFLPVQEEGSLEPIFHWSKER